MKRSPTGAPAESRCPLCGDTLDDDQATMITVRVGRHTKQQIGWTCRCGAEVTAAHAQHLALVTPA